MTTAKTQGRHDDSTRRRQRVVKTINTIRSGGGDNSVSAVARAAGVDRSYLYRHPDLLAMLHIAQTSASSDTNKAGITLESLKADLINADHRIGRLTAHNKQLERKLSEMFGEQVWRESGLGAPADIDELQRRVTQLEQQAVELHRQLEEQDQELVAARAANRELFTNLNKHS